MTLLLVAILVLLGKAAISQAGPEYDFEDNSLPIEFDAPGISNSLSVSSAKHKHGLKSLLWEWQAKAPERQGPTATLEINLVGANYDLSIKDNELKKGGLKFWMYHSSATTQSTMEIIFHSPSEETSATVVHLDFKGWRGVWIGYAEFFEGKGSGVPRAACANGELAFDLKEEGVGLDAISKVEFRITSSNEDSLYMDLVRFDAKMSKQTRDMVVKQVSSSSRTGADKYSFYDEKDFWEMSLRWYEHRPTQCTQGNPTEKQLSDISAIEERLENWYATDDQIRSLTFDQAFDAGSSGSDPTRFRDFGMIRWKGLYGKNIKTAEKLLPKVLGNKPSLFALLSEQGKDGSVTGPNTKFGLVFFEVLLPLAMKYNFKSRQDNLNQPEENEGSGDAGDSGECDDIRDDEDLKNIGELIRHIMDQGWAAGSGLGTLGHEMNKSGAGFMHSMFLLRNILKRRCSALFGRLLKAMKWYTDFNEIYQANDDYVYNGTTADRLRTILFYRLMVILMGTNQNEQARDIECYKQWVNHVMGINKGLGGFIKPDFTAFHHKTFYGSAYVPQALHNAALVYHLLEGTSFELDPTAKGNIRKVLEVLRITAVKYSTPNGISGRFPSYHKAILAQILPAYAYMSYVHGSTPDADPTVEDPEMFLRLAQPLDNPDLKAYLEKGEMTSAIHYWSTLGSLVILDKVQQLATHPTNGDPVKQPESSPTGHWSKNFAALSIHRRHDWSVAAKGFNKYVWDFEKSDAQNVYGIFFSHGSLQISNSELALKSYDEENGWDWTRIPGATTVNLGLDNIRTDNARYYNPGGFAGGVTLVGSDIRNRSPQNGAFGMNFAKPNYEMKTNSGSPLNKMTFNFKKSYFFYEHLIVAVGSDILLGGLDRKDKFYAQTTLFQDKLVDPSSKSTISIDRHEYDLRMPLKSWKRSRSSTVHVIDTHKNKYKVKTDAYTELNIEISDQESRRSNGCPDKTKGRYATAWLVHKKKKNRRAPTNSYEYAVLVNGGEPALLSNYDVKIIDNGKAHAAHFFETAPASSNGVFAYSIFEGGFDNNFGPVKSTNSPCMIMAKKETNALYLSISNPSLEFKDIDLAAANDRLRETCSGANRKDLDQDGCVQDEKNPSNSNDVRRNMMFCVQGKKKKIVVTLNCDFDEADIQSVRVDGKVKRNISQYVRKHPQPKKVEFKGLTKGFTTEIKIMNPRCAYVLV